MIRVHVDQNGGVKIEGDNLTSLEKHAIEKMAERFILPRAKESAQTLPLSMKAYRASPHEKCQRCGISGKKYGGWLYTSKDKTTIFCKNCLLYALTYQFCTECRMFHNYKYLAFGKKMCPEAPFAKGEKK